MIRSKARSGRARIALTRACVEGRQEGSTGDVWQAWAKTLEIADAVQASVVLFQGSHSVWHANRVGRGKLNRSRFLRASWRLHGKGSE